MATPITPNTDVFLLKCPLEMDNQHQMNFATRQAQINYFASLPKIEMEKFSYQRADGVIRVENHIDSIIGYNYVMYRNNNYTNRWFFAFITGMEYVNDHCTYVSIKTDVFQTWQFDLSWKRCFVEREHVNNDTFGLHTLEENIAGGEYVVNIAQDFGVGTNFRRTYVAVLLSELPSAMVKTYGSRNRIYNGIPNGCYLILLDMWDGNLVRYTNIENLVKYFDSVGKSDAIVAMYLVPEDYYSSEELDLKSFELGDYGFDGLVPKGSLTAKMVQRTTFNMNPNLNGYTPKNNKCFTKEFNFLLASNNAGSTATYNWEDFQSANDKDPIFEINACLAQNFPTKLIPMNYKNATSGNGFSYGLAGASFPMVSWNSDYYLNWQAKQGWGAYAQRGQKAGEILTEAMKPQNNSWDYIGDILHENVQGVAQGFGAIFNTINGSMGRAERTPDTVQGDSTYGDITFSMSKCCFTFYYMSVKAEVAKIVDDYFSAYGYKVSTWKTPNLTGRRNWNFVKLNQANITGNIPQTDMDEIKGMFLKGITIWHNPSTFLDYSQNNSIV